MRDPVPGPGQVRVRVEALGVNPVDDVTRAGRIPLSPAPSFPLVVGWDLAGVVDLAGNGVPELSPGDPVIGFSEQLRTGIGTYAGYVVLDAADVAPRPDGLDATEGAALPSSGLTALQALAAAEVAAGDRLLVVGAAGMVGGLVTRIASARGSDVIGVARDTDADAVRALGAREVVDRAADVAGTVRALVPGGVEVAVSAARDAGPIALDAVRDGGRFATVADMPPPPARRDITPVEVVVGSDHAQLRELADLAGRRVITAPVDRVRRLDQAGEAHALLARTGFAARSCSDPDRVGAQK